jgi:small GTP-binding protein
VSKAANTVKKFSTVSTVMTRIPKVVICGETDIGKTVFGQRLLTGTYSEVMRPTVGQNQFELDLDGQTVMFWDTAGQEKFRSLTPMYFREASIIIFAYSITSLQSLQALENFMGILAQCQEKEQFSLVVVGLKLDLDSERAVKYEDARKFGDEKLKPKPDFVLEVSSKTGEGIQSFKDELKRVIQERRAGRNTQTARVTLEPDPDEKKKKKKSKLC